MDRLSSIVESWNQDIKEDIGHDFITAHINSVEDLLMFFRHCNSNEAFGNHTIYSYSWQLFDKIHDISLGTKEVVGPMLEMIKLVCEHTRPKELHIMLAEKLVMVHSTATFELILTAAQCMLKKSIDITLWTEVLSRILQKTIQLCSNHPNDKSTEDYFNEEEQEEMNLKTENPDRFTYARLAIAFMKDFSSLEFNEQIRSALVGFLLNFNSQVVALFPEPCDRTPLLNSTAIEIVQLFNGELYDIFNYIYIQKENVFRHEMSVEKRKFCTQYCHRYSDTVKEIGAAVPLTTEDANILQNKIAMSEHSTIMMNYYESVCYKILSPSLQQYKVDSVNKCETPNLPSTAWSSLVGFDQLTVERLASLTATQQGGMDSESKGLLNWSLSGIALFGLCILRTLHYPTTVSVGVDESNYRDGDANLLHTLLPQVYNPSQLEYVLRPYAGALLRSTVFATYEGLQFASALYSFSSIADTVSARVYPSPLPVFLSFLAQTPTATALSHLLLASYHCLPLHPATRSQSAGADGAYWTGEAGARLGAMAASSTDHLALSQTLISAMTQCPDARLRTAAFQSLRAYLKGIEERSLFGLLGVLIDQCPYPNMAGLLVDLVKECTQAAAAAVGSEGAGWCTLQCPAYATTSCNTTSRAATENTGSIQDLGGKHPWCLSALSTEPTTARATYLKKLFKPSSTAATTTTARSAAEVDIDALVLRKYKVSGSQQQQADTTTGSALEEDCFIELASGATQLDAEKTVELWAAAPYVWPGQSPFWSPLLLRKVLLEPLKEHLQGHSDEQMEDDITDIVAARINLAQFIALKFLSDDHFTDTDATGITGIVQSYFQGCALNRTAAVGELDNHPFPYAYSSLKAIRDIFELYHTLRILYDTIQEKKQKGGHKTSTAAAAVVRGGEEGIVRTQLLEMNIAHVLELYKRLCQYLYKYI